MNPERILRCLDSHLTRATRLILYGRAALSLGFPNPRSEFATTMDVDAILPEVELAAVEGDDQFWNAIDATNEELRDTGLYLTHLFADSQVILSDDWLENIVPIESTDFRFLKLRRPATEDLLLTKMMRIDPQDRSDMEFLLENGSIATRPQLEALFARAIIPDIPEIQEAFHANAEWLRQKVDPNS
jgi:hypothetical protein